MNEENISELVALFKAVGGKNRARGTLTRARNEREFEAFFPNAPSAKSIALALSKDGFVPFSKISKEIGFENAKVSIGKKDGMHAIIDCSDILMVGDFGDFDTFIAVSLVDSETLLYMDPKSKDVLWHASPKKLADLREWLGDLTTTDSDVRRDLD